jgi:hypothetical protein
LYQTILLTALNALANDTLSNIAATATNNVNTTNDRSVRGIDANGIVTVAANTPEIELRMAFLPIVQKLIHPTELNVA